MVGHRKPVPEPMDALLEMLGPTDSQEELTFNKKLIKLSIKYYQYRLKIEKNSNLEPRAYGAFLDETIKALESLTQNLSKLGSKEMSFIRELLSTELAKQGHSMKETNALALMSSLLKDGPIEFMISSKQDEIEQQITTLALRSSPLNAIPCKFTIKSKESPLVSQEYLIPFNFLSLLEILKGSFSTITNNCTKRTRPGCHSLHDCLNSSTNMMLCFYCSKVLACYQKEITEANIIKFASQIITLSNDKIPSLNTLKKQCDKVLAWWSYISSFPENFNLKKELIIEHNIEKNKFLNKKIDYDTEMQNLTHEYNIRREYCRNKKTLASLIQYGPSAIEPRSLKSKEKELCIAPGYEPNNNYHPFTLYFIWDWKNCQALFNDEEEDWSIT